jgi:hypothetical protein
MRTNVEVLASVWAGIDGKLEQFQAGRVSIEHDETHGSYYQGYMIEAEEMLHRLEVRGYKLVNI